MSSKGKRYTTAHFIKAIPGSGGIVAVIAQTVGCTWHTAKHWIDNYATVAQAYADECEQMADVAESVLVKSIQGGDVADAKWFLSRIRRGKYATKTETDITTDGEPLTIQYTGNVSPDEL